MAGDSSLACTGGGACGRTRGGAYGARELEQRGREGSVAHCGCRGENGELGEELERAGRGGGSPATEVEDELGAASPGRASARGWVEAKQWTTASFLARRGNEWTAVATVELVGGDGCARQGDGKRAREGESGEKERGTWGSAWHS